jgi:hypothetical protein
VLPRVRRKTVSLVFTVPYAGYEILVFAGEGKVAGVAYDPLSTSPPTTWVGGCGKCLLGSRRVPLKVRRSVRCLSTLRKTKTGFSVRVCTGWDFSHVVSARKLQGEWTLTIRSKRDESLTPLVLTVQGGVTKTTGGRPRDYRGPVLRLALRLLMSAREASDREVRAVLLGLPRESQPRRHEHDDHLVQVADYAKLSVGGTPRGVVPRYPPVNANPAALFRAESMVVPGDRPGTTQTLHDVTLRDGHSRAVRNLKRTVKTDDTYKQRSTTSRTRTEEGPRG